MRTIRRPIRAAAAFPRGPRSSPGLDGLTLFRRMLELRPGMPILVTSGYGAVNDVTARRGGLSGFLPKPSPLAVLGEAVRRALDRN